MELVFLILAIFLYNALDRLLRYREAKMFSEDIRRDIEAGKLVPKACPCRRNVE